MTPPALPPIAAVQGTNSPAGQELREAFSRTLARSPGGAQLFVSLGGETLVDLAGGGLTEETPVQVFSISKVVVALAAAHAHASGVLDLDAPLASYWPAFDRPATAPITARMVLDHSCGINAVSRPMSVDDLLEGALEEEVARQDPHWEPGTDHGYGPFTFGGLMGGVFKHGAGVSVQEYAEKHVVAPSGGGFWFGAPAEILDSVAKLTFSPPVLTEGQAMAMATGSAILDGSMLPIMMGAPDFFSDPRVIQASWPALSGVSTARALGGILNGALGLAGKSPILSTDALNAMIAQRRLGMDRTLAHVSRFGCGVELPHGFFPYVGGRSFGHQGAGGGVACADPDSGLVFAYTCTHTASTAGGSDAALTLLGAARQLQEGY